jgi:hypothetical protein
MPGGSAIPTFADGQRLHQSRMVSGFVVAFSRQPRIRGCFPALLFAGHRHFGSPQVQ